MKRGSKYWANAYVEFENTRYYVRESFWEIEKLIKSKDRIIPLHISKTLGDEEIAINKTLITSYGKA